MTVTNDEGALERFPVRTYRVNGPDEKQAPPFALCPRRRQRNFPECASSRGVGHVMKLSIACRASVLADLEPGPSENDCTPEAPRRRRAVLCEVFCEMGSCWVPAKVKRDLLSWGWQALRAELDIVFGRDPPGRSRHLQRDAIA